MARNRIIDYSRRTARRQSRIREDVLERIPDPGVLASPQQAATTTQRRVRLLRHVDRLPEPQRVVVHPHYWQEQSIAEISEMLGMRPGTVKSQLWRARRRLAMVLREDRCDA